MSTDDNRLTKKRNVGLPSVERDDQVPTRTKAQPTPYGVSI